MTALTWPRGTGGVPVPPHHDRARGPRRPAVPEVLGRQPSPAEVQAWADFLRVTGDYSAFARGFLDSQEYLARP